MANLKLGHELVSIDPRAKELKFSNGFVGRYDGLVSSVPLPEMIRMIEGAPQGGRRGRSGAASGHAPPAFLVNVGVNLPAGSFARAHDVFLR